MSSAIALIAALLTQDPQATPPETSAAPVVATPSRTIGALDEVRFDECHDTAVDDPATGVVAANEWIAEGGGFLARQCLGFAHTRRGEFSAAAEVFSRAAQEAEAARDWRSANLWAQAGNAALAAGDAARARTALDAALAQGTLTGVQLGEAYLDRARAAAALEDWPGARSNIDAATPHVPQDPLLWLLSATLARRMGDLNRAQNDIATAAQLGPRDAAIALEAGNIAAAANRWDVARQSWQSAVTLGGTSRFATVARARLIQLDAFEREAAAAEQPASTGTDTATPAGAPAAAPSEAGPGPQA